MAVQYWWGFIPFLQEQVDYPEEKSVRKEHSRLKGPNNHLQNGPSNNSILHFISSADEKFTRINHTVSHNSVLTILRQLKSYPVSFPSTVF